MRCDWVSFDSFWAALQNNKIFHFFSETYPLTTISNCPALKCRWTTVLMVHLSLSGLARRTATSRHQRTFQNAMRGTTNRFGWSQSLFFYCKIKLLCIKTFGRENAWQSGLPHWALPSHEHSGRQWVLHEHGTFCIWDTGTDGSAMADWDNFTRKFSKKKFFCQNIKFSLFSRDLTSTRTCTRTSVSWWRCGTHTFCAFGSPTLASNFSIQHRFVHFFFAIHKFPTNFQRVFVLHHYEKINDANLRLPFLLHLIALHNANGIDKEECYDLMRRLEPTYNPQQDNAHFVARALYALEEERDNHQKGQQKGGNQQSGSSVKQMNKGLEKLGFLHKKNLV